MRSHKEYALKFLIYKFKKETVILEQNRTEQNRTEHVALHNLNLLFILLRLVYHITENLAT